MDITNIPIDNIITIFNILEVTDIINIYQTNKYFNKIIKENKYFITNKYYEVFNYKNYKFVTTLLPNIKIIYNDDYSHPSIRKNSYEILSSNFLYKLTMPFNSILPIMTSTLNSLIMSYSNVIDISNIKYLTNLEELNIWNCRRIDDFSSLEYCKLKTLNLGHTNIKVLPNIPTLTSLDISDCCILEDMSSLSNCNNFKKIIFNGNINLRIFDSLKNHKIEYIGIDNMSLLQITNIIKFINGEYIKTFHFNNYGFYRGFCSEEIINKVSKWKLLESLCLSNVIIENLNFISYFKNLNYLVINNVIVDNQILFDIKPILSLKIKHLDLSKMKNLLFDIYEVKEHFKNADVIKMPEPYKTVKWYGYWYS
jgi:hypothetical protein